MWQAFKRPEPNALQELNRRRIEARRIPNKAVKEMHPLRICFCQGKSSFTYCAHDMFAFSLTKCYDQIYFWFT